MKTKLLLIAISCTTLLFTSCEKDEMAIGEGAGGGMQNANTIMRSTETPLNSKTIQDSDLTLKVD